MFNSYHKTIGDISGKYVISKIINNLCLNYRSLLNWKLPWQVYFWRTLLINDLHVKNLSPKFKGVRIIL